MFHRFGCYSLFVLCALFHAKGVIAATITVTTIADSQAIDGFVSLREAIASINNGADQQDVSLTRSGVYGDDDTIQFNLTGSAPFVFQPSTALPSFSKPMAVDGYSQQGSTPNNHGMGLDDNAVLTIVLDGSLAGMADGFQIVAGNSKVSGMVIQNFQGDGIHLDTKGSNVIEGNFIGTNASGDAPQGNSFLGIKIHDSPNNLIGGTAPGDRNVISGNSFSGIQIEGISSTGNQILGNFIGTDVSGKVAVTNGTEGVEISSASNIVGGTTQATRNLISGNSGGAINLLVGSQGNIIQGNFIGTDLSGTQALGNGTNAIFILTSDNTIGGNTAGAGNIIAFNSGKGISIASTAGDGNSISSNSIFSNGDLGIDLGDDGVTANDSGDGDLGPNQLQNFPDLTGAVSGNGQTTVNGILNSLPNSNFRIEFFANDSCDASGNGEGQTFLGSLNVSTDAGGQSSIQATIPIVLAAPTSITATAMNSATKDSSEFSNCIETMVLTEDCGNGVDDDQDNLVDCQDPDCIDNPACVSATEICDNGMDDDGDGLIDCKDPDCATSVLCAHQVGGAGCSIGVAAGYPVLSILPALGAIFGITLRILTLKSKPTRKMVAEN